MLPLRLAIVTAAAALCLWGLFSLLDSLQEPGLLRSPKAVVVKGCDSLESAEASRLCPALFCQKALLDAKLLPLKAQFEISIDRQGDDRERLISGQANDGTANPTALYFVCTLTGLKVTEAVLIDADEFDELVQAGEAG